MSQSLTCEINICYCLIIFKFYIQLFLTSFQGIIAITKFLSIINLSLDFRVGGICLFMTVVIYILLVLSVVVSLIGGVPRMGPRVPFALLPFGHYPIKYLKRKQTYIQYSGLSIGHRCSN